MLVNLDLPWSPAVLEQRIGRVYRMGQTRGVQVFNYIAEHSIESNMLHILAFKRSLFAGILDGGDSAISLSGSRLAQFMESVSGLTATPAAEGTDALATRSGAAMTDAGAEPDSTPLIEQTTSSHVPPGPDTAQPDAPSADAIRRDSAQNRPWSALLEMGQQLITALRDEAAPNGASVHPLVEVDARSGRRSLKLPLLDVETSRKLAGALGAFLAALR